jgi:5-methyltetrahydropteroyltriglutamate--homocysteine methyltransferase
MLYSTDRILTTHAGSLPRPPELRDMVLAKANGTAVDPAAFDARLRAAVERRCVLRSTPASIA